MDKDEIYQTLLDGLGRYLDNPLIRAVHRTVRRYPVPALAYAFNKNQMASKGWLVRELLLANGPDLGIVHIMGGWYGVLAALLLHDRRFTIQHIISMDIDPDCIEPAMLLNEPHVHSGKFSTLTCDVTQLNYTQLNHTGNSIGNTIGDADPGKGHEIPDVVINTSCEHLQHFSTWLQAMPSQALLVLQSNDYFSCDEHVNCVPSLQAFEQQAGLGSVLYAGELPRKRYTRYMLIGRR